MVSSVRTFLDEPRLREEPPGLFVLSYAGHSIHREGEVYLVPTDAKLEDESEDYAIECLSLGKLLQLLRDNLDVPVRQKLGEDRAIVFLVVLDSFMLSDNDGQRWAERRAQSVCASAPGRAARLLWRGCHATKCPCQRVSRRGEEGTTETCRIFHYYHPAAFLHQALGPAGGTTDGGSAGAGGGHTRKRQVDADVLTLLREWELEDESERLAENGVCKIKDLESMNEMDRKEFGCRLGLRELLQHVAKQKENKRASDGSEEHKVHYLIKLGLWAQVKHVKHEMLQLWRALVSWLPDVVVSVILS